MLPARLLQAVAPPLAGSGVHLTFLSLAGRRLRPQSLQARWKMGQRRLALSVVGEEEEEEGTVIIHRRIVALLIFFST